MIKEARRVLLVYSFPLIVVEARVAVRMYSQVTRTDLHHIVLVVKRIIIFDFVPFAIHFEAVSHILEFESWYSRLVRTPPLQATEKEGGAHPK